MSNANDPADKGQNGAADGSDDAAKYVTKDDMAAMVNAAISSHLKRHLGSAVAAVVSKELEPLKARLDAPPPEPEPDAKAEKAKPSPEFVALQKQLADMQAALKAKDEEAQSERMKAREDRAFADLCTELTGKVRPGTERMVATLLKAEGRLTVDDEGSPLLKVRTSLQRGMPEEDHDLRIADGVPHYLKTKDAALFLPPPNQGGAGMAARGPTSMHTGARKPGQYDAPPADSDEAARRTVEQLEALGVSLADI